jgi:hypothetical protein
MNTAILKKYQMEFSIIQDERGNMHPHVTQTSPGDISYYLSGYFEAVIPEFFIEEILPEIDKAMDGQPFNEEGGGSICFLKIGRTMSKLSNTNAGVPIAEIPTQDMKDIILAWIEWMTKYDLAKYM